MSQAAARTRLRPARTRRGAIAARRRLVLAAAGVLVAASVTAGVIVGAGPLGEAVREITLPLRHDDIIRQQAAEKNLDPALVAAVIYQESKFKPDARSEAGAIGLMQLLPDTAEGIAARTGGSAFRVEDLDDPEINVRYGSWYLRHLLDKYGSEEQALAAYNGGQGNEDRGVRYRETQHYVDRVLELRGIYREAYPSELGE
jgi:soluble lytic murein transglycosylase